MNCDEAKSLFAPLLDGSLSSPDAARLARHLEACNKCCREYRLLRRIDQAIDAIGVEKAPVTLTQAVLRKLAATKAIERLAVVTAGSITTATILFYGAKPALTAAMQLAANGFAGVMSGASQSFYQIADALGHTEAILLEGSANVSGHCVMLYVVVGGVAVFLGVQALKLWKELALD
ncbi:MAG: zf-HC2 domain-containing protein [Candidatus Eisenbacteria sp.]|nr:zf-HC2 domain-containing protein [Candidatus Eisenbacteria bacterium]